jgi:hypothetical protein
MVAIRWVRGVGKEVATMDAVTSDLFLRPRTRRFRRICAWCSTDLGALTYHSDYHSYAICMDCVRQYFPDPSTVEEHGTVPLVLERAVGAG